MSTKELIDRMKADQAADGKAADQLTVSTQAKQTTADALAASSADLSADLNANGPKFVLTSDAPPAVEIYRGAGGSPGFTVEVVPPADPGTATARGAHGRH
jgi:hypothetical protein